MSFSTLLLTYPVVNQVIDKSIEYRCNRWLSALEPFNPPSENTGNKSELVGVAVSVGEALLSEFDISKKIDESLFQSCPFGSECTIPRTGSCNCENLGE